jgi:hypothetical protein
MDHGSSRLRQTWSPNIGPLWPIWGAIGRPASEVTLGLVQCSNKVGDMGLLCAAYTLTKRISLRDSLGLHQWPKGPKVTVRPMRRGMHFRHMSIKLLSMFKTLVASSDIQKLPDHTPDAKLKDWFQCQACGSFGSCGSFGYSNGWLPAENVGNGEHLKLAECPRAWKADCAATSLNKECSRKDAEQERSLQGESKLYWLMQTFTVYFSK